MKMNIKFGTLLLSFVILTACNNPKAEEQQVDKTSGNSVKVVEVEADAKDETESIEIENDSNQTTEIDNKKSSSDEETNQTQSYDITLYYPSTAFIVDGDENNRFVTKPLQLEGDMNAAINGTIEELKNTPKDAEPVGLDNLTILKTSFKEGVATIDFSSNELSGGSTEEEVLVSSIVNSLLSIKGIKNVEFLVDGESAETLMGQVDISKPFSSNF